MSRQRFKIRTATSPEHVIAETAVRATAATALTAPVTASTSQPAGLGIFSLALFIYDFMLYNI